MNVQKTVVHVGNKEITLEVGRFSEQVDAAVLATCGGTVVHATVGFGRESNLGYFPLQVEYVENLFAGGRIKGSRWVKRPGRPNDNAILTSRVIDRSIRPLFPEGMKNEVQVVPTVLSVDMENNPDTVAMVAAMAAIHFSSIPFEGPEVGIRVGYNPNADEFLFNPTYEEQKDSVLDLVLSGTKDAIVMVEAGALEVDEAVMLRAFEAGHEVIQSVADEIAEFGKKVGKEKFEFHAEELDQELLSTLRTKYAKEVAVAVKAKAHLEKDSTISEVIEKLQEDEAMADVPLRDFFDELMYEEARRMTLEDGQRPDGRALDEVRDITCELDLLPTTHGSAMFKRGATQALTIATLGSPAMGQLIEDMEGEQTVHYIHHYTMPPYASGETGRMGFPKRREIGHGALAERALLPVIPSQEDFPYTIHVASNIMSSNGSTSQASVCGSTLALMAAGVPIRKPVSGIAMGLLTDGKTHKVLTDIQGMEDHTGDMDFKVAGTKDGITAIQMDIKVKGLTIQILKEALEQAKTGRLHIMDEMLKVISEPRKEVAKNAPKVQSTKIPVDSIGALIGPGGKIIKGLIEETGADINVEDDGTVTVSSDDQEAISAAISKINALTMEFEAGMEFDGTVQRIEDYGAFVELVPGRDGLVHVSMMGVDFVKNPREVVEIGETVHVRVKEVDGDRIRLTMLTPEQEEEAESKKRESRGGRDGGDDRGDRGGDRGGRRGGFRGGDRRGGGSRGGDRGGNRSSDRGGRGRGDRGGNR